MLRVFSVVFVLQFLALPAALACEGQPGPVIFEDKFTDDSGGWQLAPPLSTIKPPVFEFALTTKATNIAAQNLTFRATLADFCLETILPKPLADDNVPSVGIEFWATDYANLMLLQLSSNKVLQLFSKIKGSYQQIFRIADVPGYISEPDAVNSLRINTIGGKLTAYLNGTQVKVVRAQMPGGLMRFGIYTQWNKSAPSFPAIKVTSYKVTIGR
jgi:hypothetical protein